jgi:hypothetical protein
MIRTNAPALKSIIGVLMITVMLLTIVVPLVSIPTVAAADSTDWYKTVSGVLSTDSYSFYPYSTGTNLKIGFSKFGEMINSNGNVGLEYGSVDPFAPPAGSSIGSIVKSDWLNGWICNITYYHTIRSEMRNVWVSAQHGDPLGVTYGGDWIRVDFDHDYSITYGLEDPRDPGYIIGNYAAGSENYGGRKTNGTAVTEPIQVLYDGPRSFVALLKTTVYDHFQYQSDSATEDIPLLEVRFMIVFEKVKKEVVVFKELKTLVTDKYTDVLKVQFSNRGEVDLGNEASGYASYFHFYTQGTSQYNANFNDTLAEGLGTVYDRNWVMNQTENPLTSSWKNYSASGPYPQVVPAEASIATYDLAVAVNPTADYTWWAAFWPSLSDWSIDGWPMWWHSMTAFDIHDIDSRTWETHPRIEPTIPYYIGEWDVELKPKGKVTPAGEQDQQMYRFVTAYGITNRHDASDANMTMGYNNIDSETKYQLNEVFNPWDLYSAVEKTTRSWVTGALSLPDVTDSRVKTDKPIVTSAINATSVAVASRTLSDNWTDNIGVGHTFKVTFKNFTVNGDPSAIGSPEGSGNWTQTWTLRKMWNETDFKVFLGETYISTFPDMYDQINVTLPASEGKGAVTFLFDIDTLEKSVTAPTNSSVISPLPTETVHVVYLNHTLDITLTVANMNITDVPLGQTSTSTNSTLSVTFDSTMQADYNDKLMGRYEWAVVGRDAESVDSAGAALITAAFKEKQVEIGIAGQDMYDAEVANQMPWVMSKKSTGDMWADYYYSGTDFRTDLRSEWCRLGNVSGDEWPIASSNMIGVGGPLANLLAYYANDFTDVMFGLKDFTNYTAWENKLVPKTCWNHTQGYTDTNTVGYAAVTTCQDLDGTVLFLVWGNWGRDTFYVSKYFLEHLVYQLQEAPRGITSVVVKISYESTSEGYKPTSFSIVECLGTISERTWVHTQQFWEGTAYSSTGNVVTTPILQSGVTYHIVASEIFWYNYAQNLEADAMYYTTEPVFGWWWANHFPAPGGHSFLQINGADVNWGPFSNGDTGHTYYTTYVGQGSSITFQIVDWIDHDYTNNSCHIPISIYMEQHKGGIHDP